MTRDSNLEWQRTTALRKISNDREDAIRKGVPVTDFALASRAANYVGVPVTQVQRWMEGRG